MILVFLAFISIVGYAAAYVVSLYALAVYIHPDELHTLLPGLSGRGRKLIMRMVDDPRLFGQIATVYKTLVLVLVTLTTVLLLQKLQAGWAVEVWMTFPVALAAIWLIHIMIVELLPRRTSLTAINARMTSFLWLLGLIFMLCYPVVALYRLSIAQHSDKEPVAEEDKEDIIERAIETLAEQAGISEALVESDEKEMIGQIFQLDQTVVREIMVPRIHMIAVEKNTSLAEIQAMVRTDGHSRYPVYEGSIDKIIGILYVKDLFSSLPGVGEKFVINDFLRTPMVVPELKIIRELLLEFRMRKVHIAVVVDEYGGVSGLVTLEDILEEIVGEIQDEHDSELPEVKRLTDGSLSVKADMLLEELQEQIGTDYQQEDYVTVGGLLYGLVGSVPKQGASLRWNDLEFEVERVGGQRIEQVRVRKVPRTA